MEYLYDKKVRDGFYDNIFVFIVLIIIEIMFIVASIFIDSLFFVFLTFLPFIFVFPILIYFEKRMYFRKATVKDNIITIYYGDKIINSMDLSKVRKSSVKVLVPRGRGYERDDFIVLHNESPLVKHNMKLHWFKKELIYINNPQLIEIIEAYYNK